MSKIYHAEIAEKMLLRNEELENFNCFKIGGKILFEDLSTLRSIYNPVFLEKTTPKGIEDFEYKEFKSDNINLNAESLNKNIWGPKIGKYIEKALIIIPIAQSRSEDDIEFICIFKNGECAVRDMASGSYSFYDKKETDILLSNYGLDNYLIHKKLEHDFEIDNNLKIESKFKLKI